MPLLLTLLLLFALLRLLVLLVNLLTRPYLRPAGEVSPVKLSVLIPARNEEENIGRLIDEVKVSAADCQSCEVEVLVYDDQSDDGTADIARRKGARVIDGLELPEGWLGKNHACHRLAQEASGDWMLFLDADVEVKPALIRNALSFVQRKKVRLLSVFPLQRMETAGEWSVVPLMNWILTSLLPLIMVRKCRWTSFSAANGQFMLFDATLYRRFQWHEKVKGDPVEDILICRMMKKRRLRVATLLGRDDVGCRMYRSRAESISGFTKNTGQFFGNSRIWMLTFALLTTLTPVMGLIGLIISPAASLPFIPWIHSQHLAILLLSVNFFNRVLFSVVSRQPVLKNLLFWPRQHLSFLLLVWKNLRFRQGQKVEWKGRKI